MAVYKYAEGQIGDNKCQNDPYFRVQDPHFSENKNKRDDNGIDGNHDPQGIIIVNAFMFPDLGNDIGAHGA